MTKFKEKPQTKIAWRAMSLGLGSLLSAPILGIFAAVGRPAIDKIAGERIGIAAGIGLMIIVFSLVITAFVTGLRAFKQGERSWVLWVGFVPATIAVAFWTFMVIIEIFFPH